MSVTVVGEVILDRVINGTSTADVLGGSAANTALALVRRGQPADLRARFGSDANGKFLKQKATSFGIDVSNSVDAIEPATVVEATIDELGIPAYKFFMDGTADWNWTANEIDKPLPENTQAVVLGSYASIVDPAFPVLYEWVLQQKQTGLLFFFDPNIRPTAIEQLNFATEARQRIRKWMNVADVLKVSDEDLAWFEPEQSPEDVAIKLSAQGPTLVVLTAGAGGAAAYSAGSLICHVSAPKVEIVDTVGAGDTLMAWLVAGVIETPGLDFRDSSEIARILDSAVKAASYTSTRRGCDPVTSAELAEFEAIEPTEFNDSQSSGD